MASIDFVLPWLDAAIASMPLSEVWPTTIGLADFGCSEGGNSIAVMQRLVSAFRKRSSRPIQTHHIDLPTNDYRELFKNLRPEGRPVFEAAETYSAAVVGSMYDQLLPPRSIHLATTFNSIAYLSRRPLDRLANYVSANGPSARRGIGEVTKEERDAFADQAEADMESFLIARAAELVPGGKLLIQNFGCGEVFRECDGNCDVLNDALLEMVDAGIIDREGYEAFYLPYYNRTLDELTAPLTKSNSTLARRFRLERAESYEAPVSFVEQFNSTGDADRFAQDYIEYIRAFIEPPLRVSFAEHVDLDRLVSEVFERTERLIHNHPIATNIITLGSRRFSLSVMAPEPRSFGLLGRSYKRRSRARARHGRSISSTGSQSANVDSREGDFGFSPDSGRGPGAALTGSFDPDGRAVGVAVAENEVIDQLVKTLVDLDSHPGSCLGVDRIDGNDALQ